MISLGIGLTSDCNLSCAHCYRNQNQIDNLSLNDIQNVCRSISINSIGFGTGENGLNPQYLEIIDYLHTRQVKLSLASNGYTLSITPDEKLKYFNMAPRNAPMLQNQGLGFVTHFFPERNVGKQFF